MTIAVLLYFLAFFVLLPGTGGPDQCARIQAGWPFAAEEPSVPPPQASDSPKTNERIVAVQTVALIAGLQDPEGQIRAADGRVVQMPLYLHFDAPVAVKESIYSGILDLGIRLAGEQAGHHTLNLDWVPDNLFRYECRGKGQRQIRSRVVFTWYDETMEMQGTWSRSFQIEDDIRSDEVHALSSGWAPADFQNTIYSRRYRLIYRLAEPVLITSAVAVTIYLLYNVRS